MNTDQLNKILFRVNPDFWGTFACNQCPIIEKRPFGIVMNTDSSSGRGEHWVALWAREDGIGEYFDSFGFAPLVPDHQKYIDTMCPNGFLYNNRTIQHPSSRSCGLFCVAFIVSKLEDIPLQKFIHKYSLDLAKNDAILKEELKPWITKNMIAELRKINLMT